MMQVIMGGTLASATRAAQERKQLEVPSSISRARSGHHVDSPEKKRQGAPGRGLNTRRAEGR
eukprot:4985960-Pyramimonas_sp.AAC.1